MNDAPHRIRLPKPWNVKTTGGSDLQSADVPSTTHEFQRNFQCPSGLTDLSRVELEIQVQDTHDLRQLECLLNEQAIDVGTIAPGLFRAAMGRDRLQSINRLTVRLMWLGERPQTVLPQVALLITP